MSTNDSTLSRALPVPAVSARSAGAAPSSRTLRSRGADATPAVALPSTPTPNAPASTPSAVAVVSGLPSTAVLDRAALFLPLEQDVQDDEDRKGEETPAALVRPDLYQPPLPGARSVLAAVPCFGCRGKRVCHIRICADGSLASRCNRCAHGKLTPCDRNLWVPDYQRGAFLELQREAWAAILAWSGAVRFLPDRRLERLSAAAVGAELYGCIRAALATQSPSAGRSRNTAPGSSNDQTPARKRRRGLTGSAPSADGDEDDEARRIRELAAEAARLLDEAVAADARLAVAAQSLGLALAGAGVQRGPDLVDWSGRQGGLSQRELRARFGRLPGQLRALADSTGLAIDDDGVVMVRIAGGGEEQLDPLVDRLGSSRLG